MKSEYTSQRITPRQPENYTVDRRSYSINDKLTKINGVEQLANIRIDPNSPRFAKACENLGIIPDEIIPRTSADYLEYSKINPIYEKVPYEHYLIRLVKSLNKVIEEREKIGIFI